MRQRFGTLSVPSGGTECSETLAHEIQTPGIAPKEYDNQNTVKLEIQNMLM
jgi:hypothetical protein